MLMVVINHHSPAYHQLNGKFMLTMLVDKQVACLALDAKAMQ